MNASPHSPAGPEDRLSRLPFEILVELCNQFGPGEGLGAFRATCKGIRAASCCVRRLRMKPPAALELTLLARWHCLQAGPSAAPPASPLLTALAEWTDVNGFDMEAAHPEDVRTLMLVLLHEGQRTGQLAGIVRCLCNDAALPHGTRQAMCGGACAQKRLASFSSSGQSPPTRLWSG